MPSDWTGDRLKGGNLGPCAAGVQKHLTAAYLMNDQLQFHYKLATTGEVELDVQLGTDIVRQKFIIADIVEDGILGLAE